MLLLLTFPDYFFGKVHSHPIQKVSIRLASMHIRRFELAKRMLNRFLFLATPPCSVLQYLNWRFIIKNRCSILRRVGDLRFSIFSSQRMPLQLLDILITAGHTLILKSMAESIAASIVYICFSTLR